ncbi:MAG: glycine cleavage system protein GcvH [Saprospiraceae bacterium]|nr:glycine cleavage system protein GcvH [Saprospiraceae bacterium]
MSLPEDLKYSKEHEWLRLDPDNEGIAIIGITDFAQGELGEIVYVELETIGEELSVDDVFGTVEAVKTTSDLFMPISGTVLEFNPALNEEDGDNPGLINEDPYGEGWIAKVKMADPAELDALLDAAAYQDLIG